MLNGRVRSGQAEVNGARTISIFVIVVFLL